MKAKNAKRTDDKQIDLPLPEALPLCRKGRRPIPNICLRSALFGVIQRGRRRMVKDEVISAQSGYTILYTGERLDQNDLDVWEQALFMSRTALGKRVHFSARDFLREINRNVGGSQIKWLFASFNRLTEGSVKMQEENRNRGFIGHLIANVYYEDDSYALQIDPLIAKFFEDDAYTIIAREQRYRLDTELAKWLHGYYSTHKKPMPIPIQRLQEWCGSEVGSLYQFRYKLKSSLKELEEVGFLKDFCVDKSHDVLLVQRA